MGPTTFVYKASLNNPKCTTSFFFYSTKKENLISTKQKLINMPGARTRIPNDHRNSVSGGREYDVFDHPAATFANMVFGFLEDGNESLASSGEEYPRNEIMLEEEDEEKVNSGSMEEDKKFWENQNQLLQVLFLYNLFFPTLPCIF